MNSADYVSQLIADQKAAKKPDQEIAWNAALACEGWAYIFGARGQECTPAYRRSAYSSHGADHPTIKSKCKNFNGTGACSGCKWYPDKKRTRTFDCRGFTYWILKQVYDWTLSGAGATSQWNTASNWTSKGEIASMPKDTLCCLFVQKGKTMEHTGFGLNDATIECSNGVQYFTSRNKKWTHWAVPKCVSGDVPVPPTPEPPEGYAIVTGKQVALRKGPGTDCAVITRVPTGKQVKIETPPADWEYVSYNGKKGYMMKKYIREG